MKLPLIGENNFLANLKQQTPSETALQRGFLDVGRP
jgi:hypothetical protein